MLRSKRFDKIREIAANSAKDLGRALGEAGSRVADLEGQLVKLESYRAEYMQNVQSATSMDVVKLQNYRSFLDRLGEALRQQAAKLEAARAEYERRRSVWSEKRGEAESLNRVIDRFRKEEQYDAEQREQREGDEAAMRLVLAARE